MENYRRKIYESYVSVLTNQVFSFNDGEYDYFKKEFYLNYGPYLPENKQVSILELGCGPGFFLYFLEQNGFSNFTGVDFSDEQISIAEKKIKGKLMKCDINEFLKFDQKFNLIALRHVLEHFKKEEILEILENMSARLENGGVLLIEVPNCGSPFFGSYNRHVDFTHEVGFTVESLREILSVSGFEVAHIGPYEVLSITKRALFGLLNRLMRIISKKEIYFDTLIIAIARKR